MTTLTLEDVELQDAAQAARAAAVRADSDAERQSNPTIRAMFDSESRRYRELASKFERARMGKATPK